VRTPLERHALSRRELLRLIGAAGGLAVAGPLLHGCSDEPTGSGSRGGGTTGSTLGSRADAAKADLAAYDADKPYWLQGNFAPVFDEVEITDLVVEGTIPRELDGLYVRNGSNPATGESPHWFLGDGMVHGLRIEGGKARWYRNRYLDTPMYRDRAGLLGGGAPGGANNQSNVSVFQHGDRLLSSGEVGWPYELSTDDLSTVGPYDFDGRLTTAMTAHPKIDPATGDLHFFGYGFAAPNLTYHVASADGTLRHSEEVPIPRAVMMHDFAITDSDVVFWDFPMLFDLDLAIKAVSGQGGEFPFRWDPSAGSRLGVMPLGGPASATRWVDIEPCYMFHGTNAHRDGDRVVLDGCWLPSAFVDDDERPSSIRRWTIEAGPVGSSQPLRVGDDTTSDLQMDLPGIDRRFVGRRQRFAWYATIDDDGPVGFEFAGVARLDHVSGEVDRWEPGPHYRAGEVVLVPRGRDEGDAWALTFAYDRTTDTSDLVILDAADLAAGPVGRVVLPRRVPYGFHGWWIPGDA
jgi:carotenoid cleavage dioxygenase